MRQVNEGFSGPPGFYGFSKMIVMAAGFATLVLLSACAAAPSAPEDNFYRISPVAAGTLKRSLNAVVEVEPFVASGALGNRPLLYREPASKVLRGYHYHLWLEPPSTLLQNALVSYLRSAKALTMVVTPPLRATPGYTVTGRVLRLEMRRGKRPAGVVALELSLRREGDGTLMFVQEYRATVVSAANTPAAGVAAIDKAVGDVFRRFSADLETALERKARP